MTLHRIASTLAAAGLVALASSHALAAGFSGQEDALLQAEAARAPLALSGDGAWRLHVDAHDVLHRASLADPAARESTLQLPHGVRVLSASNDGSKVALSTDHQCIGLVDFTGDAPRLSWRPWVVSAEGIAVGPERAGWTPQLPATCGDPVFLAPVAISSDGKLVATAGAVVDSATNRVVASLPPLRRGRVLRLQFVDHDARLLIAGATMGEHRESASGPSGLSFSVWDLASKTLVNDIEIGDTPLAVADAMQVGFSPQTGALFYVDERRRARAQQAATSGDAPVPPLDLVQLWPGACGSAPRTRAAIVDDMGPGVVVDPYGRWVASVHLAEAPRDAAEIALGARSVLVVRTMGGGRELMRMTSPYALTGLVASPDGATLFALAAQPREPETGETIAGWPAVPDGQQLVRVDVSPVIAGMPRDAAKAWESGFCKEAGETPGARAMARSEHPLKPLWSRDLSADAQANASSELKVCADAPAAASLFKAADGGLWLDLATHVAKLEPLTGKTADGLPTPRTKTVCSVVTPAGNGFLNAGGDTLTWRPLAAATDPTKRRVVDRHAGWSASFAPLQPANAVRVFWSASPRATVDRDANDNPLNLLIVDYDSNGKRQREIRTNDGVFEDGEGGIDLDPTPAPCHDDRGTPLAIGYDWRAGPFDSQRGATCGPLPGMARLVWWSGAAIAPRLDDSATTTRAQPAIDGAIAVVADDSQLHVVDLALQREFAQIDLSNVTDGRAWVLASRKLVLVEATGADKHRWLRAYALP